MPETNYFTGIDVVDAVRIDPLTVTQDGIYTAPTGVLGYNPVTVKCNEPWEPLEDGYSNFWFELTDDTLSPWLNFSAKNNDAVIDWGDGSGEVALDTLTPTHTYSKAGRYVVKVKGVTGIAQQLETPYTVNTKYYNTVLKYIEFNNEVTSLANYAFWNCSGLQQIIGKNNTISTLGYSVFYYCALLKKVDLKYGSVTYLSNYSSCFSLVDVDIPQTVTLIGNNAFATCISLQEITIPASVTSIGNSVFSANYSLHEIHVQATTPPALGTYVFSGLPTDFIIYVPTGTAETYKAASGWSTYADHITEEGSTLTRAQLAKIQNETNDEEMR